MNEQLPKPDRVDRRAFLLGAGAAVLVVACGGGDDESTDPTSGPTGTDAGGSVGTVVGATEPTTLTAADFDGLPSCVLLPELTAGPFPLDEQFERRDVTEGRPGHPVRLGFRVVDGSCEAVPGAAVEIWHADASGDYSAFADGGGGKDEAEGTTFLRGTQVADAAGIVEFTTIYPGWYPGRAVHIHLRVRVDGDRVLTSQVFFEDAYTESVYEAEPYAEFGAPDTTNAADGIAGDPEAEGTLLVTTPTDTGSGTLALLNLGVGV